jgi:hypothetical protein
MNIITKKQIVLIAALFNDSRRVVRVTMDITSHVDAT